MADLTSIIGNLQRLGFYDFVLPWLLFFAILLGILKTHKVISEDAKLNAIIAAVVAFFIVNFVPFGGISAFYSTTFGVSGMILGALLVFVLFVGVLGYKPNADKEGGVLPEDSKKWAYPIIAILFIAFALIAYTQATGGSLISGIGIDNDTLTLIFILAFVLVVIGYVGKGKPAETQATAPADQEKPRKLH